MQFFFIGESELVTAFRFVGVPGVAVNDPRESLAVFRRVTRGLVEEAGVALPDAASSVAGIQADDGVGTRVLIISEEVADSLGQELADWQLSGEYPLVVELPGLQGRIEGRKTLVDSIRDAIGIRV